MVLDAPAPAVPWGANAYQCAECVCRDSAAMDCEGNREREPRSRRVVFAADRPRPTGTGGIYGAAGVLVWRGRTERRRADCRLLITNGGQRFRQRAHQQ